MESNFRDLHLCHVLVLNLNAVFKVVIHYETEIHDDELCSSSCRSESSASVDK